VTSVAAWDGTPVDAAPIRWSEVAPAVVPRQTLVSVEISDGTSSSSSGVAGLTYYVDPDVTVAHARFDASLSQWLGAAVQGPPRRAAATNPYDPRDEPLRSTVELAVLDALGRATGLPVAAFLGGVRRTQLQAYASLPSFADPGAALSCASDAVRAGFAGVKFHATGSLDADLATIAGASERLGRATHLMWDASCAYDLYSAAQVGNALSRGGFLWFEAPLADDSAEALRSLAHRIQIPLVPDGMAQRAAADWARGVADGTWGALRVDVTRAHGIASAVRLLRLSETLGTPCEIQSFGFPLSQYSNLQLMLATHACRFFEAPFPSLGLDDGLTSPPPLVDGSVLAPVRPGLGHDVDVELLSARCRPIAEVSL